MSIKVVQLESQSERSLLTSTTLQSHPGFTLLQTSSEPSFLQYLEATQPDLLLCSASDLSPATRALLHHRLPHIPLILLATGAERRALLPTLALTDHDDTSSPPTPWDILTPSELDRLPLAVSRAVHSARHRLGLHRQLTQSQDLLLSCQKSVAIGRLLGSIAHEINNPLEAIANLLYLGQRNLADHDETRTCFQMAEDELQRVGEITKQILHFHRDSKATQEVLLPDILEGILLLYRNRLAMRNIQVVRQYRSSRRVLARPGELRQAFANLIANAIDAMPRGGQLILRIRESNPRSLTITIADRGEGIPPAALCRIGEPLFTTKGEAGTGLGLWVTYQLIAKYGGAVRVYSSTRSTTNGTVFRICFTDATTLYANPTPDTSTPLHPQSNPLPSPQPSNPPLPSPIQKRA